MAFRMNIFNTQCVTLIIVLYQWPNIEWKKWNKNSGANNEQSFPCKMHSNSSRSMLMWCRQCHQHSQTIEQSNRMNAMPYPPKKTKIRSENGINQCSTIMNRNRSWLIDSHKSLDPIKNEICWMRGATDQSEMPKIFKFSLTTFNEDFYMHKIIFGFSVQNQTKSMPKAAMRNSEQFNGKPKKPQLIFGESFLVAKKKTLSGDNNNE